MNVKLPNGLIGEVQINTKAMMKAKVSGHKWYEIQRTLEAKQEKSELSSDERQKLLASIEAQRQIYEEAWRAADGGTPPDKAMSKALDPSSGFTFFELDGAFFRAGPKSQWWCTHVLRNGAWVPNPAEDKLKPSHFGDRVPDPTKGKGGEA